MMRIRRIKTQPGSKLAATAKGSHVSQAVPGTSTVRVSDDVVLPDHKGLQTRDHKRVSQKVPFTLHASIISVPGPASSPRSGLNRTSQVVNTANTPGFVSASPICVPSPSKTISRGLSICSNNTGSSIVSRGPVSPSSSSESGARISFTSTGPYSSSAEAGECSSIARRDISRSASPFNSSFLAPNRFGPGMRTDARHPLVAQSIMKSSKRRHVDPPGVDFEEMLDLAVEHRSESSEPLEDPQPKKQVRQPLSSCEHMHLHPKGHCNEQENPVSERTAAPRTKRNTSPIVQVPAQRKRTHSAAISEDESSASDSASHIPLLRHARKRPPAAKSRLESRTSVSSTTSLDTAEEIPAGRQLRNTRARQKRMEQKDEVNGSIDDDSDVSEWQGDDADDSGVVRSWLQKKGYWRGAPENVKRALR